ncbi:hypothetical protein SESBI_36736 [Sesbania bispinosa]|nr:hypothetical protein SESBI_36736 [Sesbania bispinosa]
MVDTAMVEGTSCVKVTTLDMVDGDMVEGFCNRENSDLQTFTHYKCVSSLRGFRRCCRSPSQLDARRRSYVAPFHSHVSPSFHGRTQQIPSPPSLVASLIFLCLRCLFHFPLSLVAPLIE